jgi:hypothetical protein
MTWMTNRGFILPEMITSTIPVSRRKTVPGTVPSVPLRVPLHALFGTLLHDFKARVSYSWWTNLQKGPLQF